MFSVIKTNLKHFFITFTLLFSAIVAVAIYHGAEAHFNQNKLAYTLDKEGPHVFFEGEELRVNYVRGNSDEGFYNQSALYTQQDEIMLQAYFPLEEQIIEFRVNSDITIPAVEYDDGEPILAVSDIEGNYKAFRDFLIAHDVIDAHLNWQFGKGHLVLLGDFVDRGQSVTQVLWFIYKLEQDAKRQGGKVHFILGNHEIKNLQGNFYSASEKYLYIASMIGKTQMDLFSEASFLGRYLESKNSLEKINGRLFVHGGIHPDISEFGYSLQQINSIVRAQYRHPYFSAVERSQEAFLVSTKTGPSWYRGYFKDDLSQQQVEAGLDAFGASAVIVGHTIQWSVNHTYDGRVFAIDVRHPGDYENHFPIRSSEGLLIDRNQYYRLLENGEQLLLYSQPH